MPVVSSKALATVAAAVRWSNACLHLASCFVNDVAGPHKMAGLQVAMSVPVWQRPQGTNSCNSQDLSGYSHTEQVSKPQHRGSTRRGCLQAVC